MSKPFVVYLLRSFSGQGGRVRAYTGSTNDLWRRLRQHNGEISGGARATTRGGAVWEVSAYVGGFTEHREALSFEWHAKHPHGGRSRVRGGLEGRRAHIEGLLRNERWQHLAFFGEPPFAALQPPPPRRKRRRSPSPSSCTSSSAQSETSASESSSGDESDVRILAISKAREEEDESDVQILAVSKAREEEGEAQVECVDESDVQILAVSKAREEEGEAQVECVDEEE